MRIMKTGEPCPCCGQAIPAMLPVDKRLLASIVAEGLAIQDAVRTVEHGVVEGQEAMTALTPPNDPLTLDQLREMKDKPAYLKVFDPLLESGWHIIKAVTEDKIIFRGWQTVYVPIDGMGIDSDLYRRPPEGEV